MKGLVIKTTGKVHTVIDCNDNIFFCKLKGSQKLDKSSFTNPISVGDKVLFKVDKESSHGIIEKIEPRLNYVIRKSVNLSRKSQILASNIDSCILLVTIKNPVTTTLFIDRFLVTLNAYKITPVLLFNKIDLYDKKSELIEKKLKSIYTRIGIESISASILNKQNVGAIYKILKNKTTLIAGHSGVGKTSLINLLNPKLDLKVNEISSYHQQGVHTTTFASMFRLPDYNAFVIDSPGIRGFGLVDISKNMLSNYFPEMKKFSSICRFNNCLHINEPDCNILAEIKNGNISISRYESYLNMLEDEKNYRYNKQKND